MYNHVIELYEYTMHPVQSSLQMLFVLWNGLNLYNIMDTV